MNLNAPVRFQGTSTIGPLFEARVKKPDGGMKGTNETLQKAFSDNAEAIKKLPASVNLQFDNNPKIDKFAFEPRITVTFKPAEPLTVFQEVRNWVKYNEDGTYSKTIKSKRGELGYDGLVKRAVAAAEKLATTFKAQ